MSFSLESVIKSRDLTGKVALVTGSSSGIGADIAKMLATLGAQVVITGRNATDIGKVAEEAEKLSPKKLKPLQVVADLNDDQSVASLVEQTIKAFGQLDILVNNAGNYAYLPIDHPEFMAKFDQVHRLVLRAVTYLNHLAVPHLKRSKGNIVHISASVTHSPIQLFTPYCMAKAGIDMMTKCLAIELGPHGVRVNAVNPGKTETSSKLEGIDLSKIDQSQLYKKIPLKRIGSSLDVAKGVAFLASIDAQFITGANLVIDGGAMYTQGGTMD